MKRSIKQLLSAMLVIAMMLSMLVVPAAADTSAAKGVYVFEAKTTTGLDSETITDLTKGIPLGTDGYFTAVPNATKAKTGVQANSDAKMQSFDDGYTSDKRWTFDGKSSSSNAYISFKTGANPGTVQVWWISGGDGRQLTITSGSALGTEVFKTDTSVKNTTYYTKKVDLEPNTDYFICNPDGTNYICKIEVKETSASSTYTLDVDAEIKAAKLPDPTTSGKETVAASETAVKLGTKDFFSLINTESKGTDVKTMQNEDKTLRAPEFPDGSTANAYLQFPGEPKVTTAWDQRTLEFTMSQKGMVKVWWVSADKDRPLVIHAKGETENTVAYTAENPTAKEAAYVDAFNLDAGTYRVAGNKPYIYKIEVTPGKMVVVPSDAKWDADTIGTPTVSDVAVNAKDSGSVDVTVTGVMIGTVEDETSAVTYAKKVTVSMMDSTGKVVETQDITKISSKTATNVATFTPTASGAYTFKAEAVRGEEETPIAGAASAAFNFTLPLAKAVVKSATSKGLGEDGKGTVEVVWNATDEATGYNVYNGTTKVNTDPVVGTSLMVTGLTVGDKLSFAVEALRGTEVGAKSDAVDVTVTEEAQRTWAWTRYGESATEKTNGFEGSVNDNNLKVWSHGGKITDKGDGVSFYGTAIPESNNFTLRARVKVDSWTYSNGQEGFGLLATDTWGEPHADDMVYNNNYMFAATKSQPKEGGERTKYTGYLGLTFIEETGYTDEWLAEMKASGTPIAPPDGSNQLNMDPWVVDAGIKGNYNLIGNNTGKYNPDAVNIDVETAGGLNIPLQTEFIMELERNNTGYFARLYDAKIGDIKDQSSLKLLIQQKTYKPDSLSVQDPDNVYVGFFAARNADISVTDVVLVDSPKSEWPEAEKPDPIYVTPNLRIASYDNANTEDYTLILTSNVQGTATVNVAGTTYTADVVIQGEDTPDAKTGLRRANIPVKLKPGKNTITATMDVWGADKQNFANDYTFLSTDKVQQVRSVITYETKFAAQNNLYVSPKGSRYNKGTETSPLDLQTAVNVAQPGQKILMMEGTYKFSSPISVGEGMNGTPEKPIYLVKDPAATTRPVLDFQKKCVGVKFSADYWYCYGFDVTNAVNGEEGIALEGSNNVFDQVNTYKNGGSGFQISRISGMHVLKKDWPSNNVLVNCVSYLNMDVGHEDADGFGTKLTIGEGNVFYGCVAAYNCDDGWDCFAKATTGQIGKVVLYNCYAFMNGYVLNDAGDDVVLGKGNGNGFKMGGEGIKGGHEVHDSIAFNNKAKGLDSNSCPDVGYFNSISYNNQAANVAFYGKSGNTAFNGQNIMSIKDDTAVAGQTEKDNLKGEGSQVVANYNNETTYYWDGAASKNSKGEALPAPSAIFVDTDMDAAKAFIDVANDIVKRNEDGTVAIGDFLKLKDDAPAAAKAVAPKALDLSSIVYPITIDPNYAIITPDEIPDDVDTGSSATRPADRGDAASGVGTTPANTVNNRVNAAGDKLITVKDPTGEVLADLTLPATVPTTDKKFADVPEDHWAADAINEMAARGIVKGVDEENFDKDGEVTRGTLALMLFRLSNGKEGYDNTFADVSADSWYKDAVAWASKAGVVTGFGDGTFGGDQTITREQLALMLYRYADLLGMDTTQTTDLSTFADVASVDSWASAGMNWAVANGIINGVGENTLAPTATATRAQTALMLQRFIALVK